MDEHNVHHFWGLSPALDLLALASHPSRLPLEGGETEIKLLQVSAYDARHTLTTLCQAARHRSVHAGPVHFYLHEEEPEVLARHLLLLSVLLDGSLPARDRMHTLLELHGNVLLREKTADYLDQRARALETLLVLLAAGSSPDPGSPEVSSLGSGIACLAQMLDLSMLKFNERDLLVEAVHKYRKQVEYDMVKAWDARCRKWYGDRYDFRKNMIDWDYHMRLTQAGTPGQDSQAGSIIHFHHFRHWRMHGVAYELRDSAYSQPNRSLLSTAVGRTKEFKDRNLKDVGRSVSAWGYWGDLVNGPYHSFGTVCEEPSFFAVSNKQFSRTAVDIAEHNILALLHELRTGERFVLPAGREAHRAKVARGPTSIQDLQEEGEKAGAKEEKENGSATTADASYAASPGADSSRASEGSSHTREEQQSVGRAEHRPEQPPLPPATLSSDQTAPSASSSSNAAHTPAHFVPSSSFRGACPGYLFKTGPQGLGYYLDNLDKAAAAGTPQVAQPPAQSGRTDSSPPGPAANTATDKLQTASASATSAEEARLREAEAALDAAAHARVASGFKLVLVSGDLVKGLTGRKKLHGAFDVVTLGHRHMHLAGPQYQLQDVANPSGLLVVEDAHYMLHLNREQAAAFRGKIEEIAGSAGWGLASGEVQGAVPEGHVAFKRASDQIGG